MPYHCALLDGAWLVFHSLCEGSSLGAADNVSTHAVALLWSPNEALLGKLFWKHYNSLQLLRVWDPLFLGCQKQPLGCIYLPQAIWQSAKEKRL